MEIDCCWSTIQFDAAFKEPIRTRLNQESAAVTCHREEADAFAADPKPTLASPIAGPASASATNTCEVVPELERRHPDAIVSYRDRGEVVSEGRAFAKGDKVCVSFAILDAPRDAQARVDWIAKPGGKRAEETKPLPGGGGIVSFTAETKDWETGTYTVETWIVESGPRGTRRLGNADFSLANPGTK